MNKGTMKNRRKINCIVKESLYFFKVKTKLTLKRLIIKIFGLEDIYDERIMLITENNKLVEKHLRLSQEIRLLEEKRDNYL